MLLFIDTGDNCRCPLASGYLQKLLEQRNIKYIDIKTAGVMTPTGLLPTPEVVQLLQEENVDIRRHRSRPLSLELIRMADLILGMTPIHVQKAIRMTDDARGKTFLLKEYVGKEGRNVQIPDPMGGTLEIFKKCFTDIRQSLQRLVEMEFIAKPPEAREMVVVDTTPAAMRPPPPVPRGEGARAKAKAAAEAGTEKVKPAPAPRVSEPSKPAKSTKAGKPAPKKTAAAKPQAKSKPKATPKTKSKAVPAKKSAGGPAKKAKK